MRRRKCRRVSSTIFRLRSTLHSHIDFICTCHTYDDGFPSCLCFSYSSSTKIYTAAPFSFSVPSTPLSALDEDGFIELASDAALPNSFFTCANMSTSKVSPGVVAFRTGEAIDRGGLGACETPRCCWDGVELPLWNLASLMSSTGFVTGHE
mmetsp:Transcript_15249/g.34870  ORF Transcript_15249/g.34870 Transcript_15249/m.34870 type:complete len:151 (+) Transcript_15249:1577-2029(+)